MATWICTPFGILMPGLRPDHTYNAAEDPREIQVRCREKDYLDRFRELYCPELGESLHFDQDYPWKAYVTKDALAVAIARLILDTDSEVFKPLTSGPKGVKDARVAGRLHSCYNTMWSDHLRWGDGTSSYDRPALGTYKAGKFADNILGTSSLGTSKFQGWQSSSLLDPAPAPADYDGPLYGDAEQCAQNGHWFKTTHPVCLDCSAPKPESWRVGDPPVYPGEEDYGEGEDGARAAYDDFLAAQLEDDADEDCDPAMVGRCPGCSLSRGKHKTSCRYLQLEDSHTA